MSSKGQRARGSSRKKSRSKKSSDSHPPVVTFSRQAAWILAAGAWLFLVLALASFNSSDAPSYAVAVHNDPPANLCGQFGAAAAFWIYHVAGLSAWLLLTGAAGGLIATLTGRPLTHPVVRGLGVVLITVTAGGIHALLRPDFGPLPGAPAGLVGIALTGELQPRFGAVGALLILFAGFGIGAIVAVDRLLRLIPELAGSALGRLASIPAAALSLLRQLLARPSAALSGAVAGGGRRGGRTAASASGRSGQPAARKSRAPEPEYDEEEADEEWEYVDENGDPVDEVDDDDAEWEYEDEDEEEDDESADDEDTDGAPQRAPLSDQELRAKISRLPVRMANRTTRVARDEDIPRTEDFRNYNFPTLDLLKDPERNFSEKIEEMVRAQAQQLEQSLNIYGIEAEVVGIESGPAITLYSVQLAPGTKVAKVQAIASDIARSLGAPNIRIVSNIVGKTAIGIEVPNIHREKVRLKELMSGGHADGMILPMFLGKDASGEPLVGDLTKMPHMLIAGTTGSGKSVCMNTILMSWLYTKRPDELKLVLVDPKMVEMSQFQDIPHLMCPVVTESAKAAAIMEWAVERMEERYELLREARVQNIQAYNKLSEEELYEAFAAESDEEKARIAKQLPYMVFVVDELADLMMTCREVEQSIVRIAQKARAVGIHLILATQRPQANVVTGLIKANMPCRVSFKVASGMDSRIVLDAKGAELLLGQGDMMFLTPHSSDLQRAQGTLVENAEIKAVTKFLRNVAGPTFERSLMSLRRSASADGDGGSVDLSTERDPLFDKAVEIIIESGRGSVSLLQRRLGIGYGRSSRLVDQMGLAGILGDHKGSVAREVLITLDEWHAMRQMEENEAADGTLFAGDDEKAG